jgi:WD40 repeat protein
MRSNGTGTVWAALCVAVLAFGVGCRKDAAAAQPAPQKVEKAVAPSAPAQPPTPVYPEETYGDPEFAKSPRIQFLWNPVNPDSKEPGAEDPDTIWSMKLDGTDIRRAISPKVLFGGEVKDLHDVARSPDGRYIACTGEDAQRDEIRCLIDLKEKTVRVISKMDGRAYFNWTPDSRQVIFYGSAELWQYDVTLGKLTHLPLIYSAGLRLIDGGKRFVTLNDYKIEYYSRAGKLLKTVPHPYEAGQNHTIYLDGRTFLLTVGGDSVVFRSDHPDKVLWRDHKFRPYAVFGPDGNVLLYTGDAKLTALDLRTGEETVVAANPGGGRGALTLLNAGSAK